MVAPVAVAPPVAARRTWLLLVPAAVLTLLAGFHRDLMPADAIAVGIEGLVVLYLWIERTAGADATAAVPTRTPAAARPAVFVAAVGLAIVGAALAVAAMVRSAATREAATPALLTATVLAPLVVLPALGTAADWAARGPVAAGEAASGLVGLALLDVCGGLPLVALAAAVRARVLQGMSDHHGVLLGWSGWGTWLGAATATAAAATQPATQPAVASAVASARGVGGRAVPGAGVAGRPGGRDRAGVDAGPDWAGPIPAVARAGGGADRRVRGVPGADAVRPHAGGLSGGGRVNRRGRPPGRRPGVPDPRSRRRQKGEAPSVESCMARRLRTATTPRLFCGLGWTGDSYRPAAANADDAGVSTPTELPQTPPTLTIDRKPFGGEVVDVMGGSSRWEVKVHDHGLVALLDVMPRLVPAGKTADAAIVQAARVSYGAGTKQVNEDRGLIRYLVRHRHSTPLEMVEFKFHHVMPIFVARQWVRHRTASLNEISGRYSVITDRFYRPTLDNVRQQSATNRQGGEEPIDNLTARQFLDYLDKAEGQYAEYERLMAAGVSRELARIALPVSTYTEWYWKCDLHNTLRFLSLRMDAHAQQEIRDYAAATYALIQPIVPLACEAFADYELGGLHLTRLEIESMRSGQPLASDNKREQAEWAAKRERLGL